MTSHAEPGHFYAVGVGPGNPALVTVQAVDLVRTADRILAPRAEKSASSLAVEAIRPWLEGKEVVEHVYPMTRNLDRTLQSWSRIADQVVEDCEAGLAVVQVTLGDPLIYSTSAYLLGLLENRLPPERVHVTPGISAFQAAASRFGDPLLLQEDRLLLMPATDLAAVEEALERCETLILYKAGGRLPQLKELLTRRELAATSRVAFYVDQGDRESLIHDLSTAAPQLLDGAGYMATVIVRIGHREWTR